MRLIPGSDPPLPRLHGPAGMPRRTLGERAREAARGFLSDVLDGLGNVTPAPPALRPSSPATSSPAPSPPERRRREIPANVLQEGDGEPFAVTFAPHVGYRWDVERVVVSVPGWETGVLFARIYVDGVLRGASSHGQEDVWSGGVIPMLSSQTLMVRWEPQVFTTAIPPTQADRPVQGQATITVDESPE